MTSLAISSLFHTGISSNTVIVTAAFQAPANAVLHFTYNLVVVVHGASDGLFGRTTPLFAWPPCERGEIYVKPTNVLRRYHIMHIPTGHAGLRR